MQSCLALSLIEVAVARPERVDTLTAASLNGGQRSRILPNLADDLGRHAVDHPHEGHEEPAEVDTLHIFEWGVEFRLLLPEGEGYISRLFGPRFRLLQVDEAITEADGQVNWSGKAFHLQLSMGDGFLWMTSIPSDGVTTW